MSLKIAFVAEGNAETRDCWSGCAQGFVRGLRSHGVSVDVFDAELRGAARWRVALGTMQAPRSAWKAMFNFGDAGFRARSARASRLLRASSAAYDVIIQAGATFRIAPDVQPRALRVVYADSNLALALEGRPYSGVSHLPLRLLARMMEREQAVYDEADRIWPWSDNLAASFHQHFGQPVEKLRTIGAGANTDPGSPERTVGGSPKILFVGKDHRRKGSDVVLRAFVRVRSEIAGAELHFVGSDPMEGAEVPGVFGHGFIPAGTPEGRARIDRLYREATVFCLPSRYEPFGVSFVEAMLAGLPCIGSDRWAMPEIIEHGATGWLVPDGDASALEATLIEALSEPARAREMGAAGRVRALELFTWEKVAARASADIHAQRQTGAALHARSA